jgi:hypothetical protein
MKVLKFFLYVFGRLAFDYVLNKPYFHVWKVYENIRLEPKLSEFIKKKLATSSPWKIPNQNG